jgi:hypothetical protein
MLDGPWDLVFQLNARDLAELKGSEQVGAGPGRIQAASIAATDGREGNRGSVLQNFNIARMRVENRANGRFGHLRIEASISPVGDSQSELLVKFDKAALRIWPLPFEFVVPILWFGAKGRLDTTYLSDDVRIGRGDKGTLFCLVRPLDVVVKNK